MPDRYFSDRPIEKDQIELDGSEAHHLAHVMRAKPGDEVVLFDGSGAEFDAVVAEVRRGRARLRIVSRRQVCRELPFPLTLAVALPKGERQKWLVEKAVELGVARLISLRTARSVAQPSEEAVTRLRRAVIEASKQCGRNRLMEIAAPSDLHALLADAPPYAGFPWQKCSTPPAPPLRRLIAHPECSEKFSPGIGPVVAAIGPEGGFTEEELLVACQAGWQPVSLGPRLLRVETAAIALAATLGAIR